MSQNEKVYKGNCFCGAVEIVVSGDAEVAAYCHCESCRSWSASPVNAGTLWKPDAVQVTRGAEHIGEFRKTERSHRHWCKLCGGHVMNRHPDSVIASMRRPSRRFLSSPVFTFTTRRPCCA